MTEQKMQVDNKTNLEDFFSELGAGAFKEKLALALSEAALGVVINGMGTKKSKVTIDFTISQIGENDQVIITHKLTKSIPTKRGKKMEENITETPMFVGKGGVLTIDIPRESMTGQFGLDVQHDGVKETETIRKINAQH